MANNKNKTRALLLTKLEIEAIIGSLNASIELCQREGKYNQAIALEELKNEIKIQSSMADKGLINLNVETTQS